MTSVQVPLRRDLGRSFPTAPARRAAALTALLGGLAIVAAVTGIAAASLGNPGDPAAEAAEPGRPGTDVAADISIAEVTYGAGESSGWHVHLGVHSVVVLGGTLTIHDESCARQDYGPGASYLGGSRPHRARNEGSDELTVVVTSVYRQSSTGEHGSAVPAPSGCEVR